MSYKYEFNFIPYRRKSYLSQVIFRKVKGLSDTLTSIGHPLKQEELVSFMLAGLGSEYDVLVTRVTTKTNSISLSDLYANLLSFEMRLEHHNSVFQIEANNASRNLPNANRGGTGRGNRNLGRSRGRDNQAAQRNSSPRPTCQICGKVRNEVIKCFHRYNHTYQDEDMKVATTANSASYNIDPSWYIGWCNRSHNQ